MFIFTNTPHAINIVKIHRITSPEFVLVGDISPKPTVTMVTVIKYFNLY